MIISGIYIARKVWGRGVGAGRGGWWGLSYSSYNKISVHIAISCKVIVSNLECCFIRMYM